MAKPTHVLKLVMKQGEIRNNRAGVGWATKEGWISITLDPGIVLDWRDQYYINLYPYTKEKETE